MTPRPVIVHTPKRSHRRHREAEEVALRRKERENRYEDDGWACYEVPPDPQSESLPDWVVWTMTAGFSVTGVAVVVWLWWRDGALSRRAW